MNGKFPVATLPEMVRDARDDMPGQMYAVNEYVEVAF
jgi:hypothetical protein